MKVCPNCQNKIQDDNADKCIACSFEFEDVVSPAATEVELADDTHEPAAGDAANAPRPEAPEVKATEPQLQPPELRVPTSALGSALLAASLAGQSQVIPQQPPTSEDEAAEAGVLVRGSEDPLNARPPKLTVLTPVLTFNIKRGKSGVEQLKIRNNGGQTLTGKLETFHSWLGVEPQSLIPQHMEQSFNVTVNTKGLVPGEHSATIHLTTNGGGGEAQVRVIIREHWWIVHAEPLLALLALIVALGTLSFATDIYYLFFNRPPVFKGSGIEVSKSTVNHGEKVKLFCRADDPNRDKLQVKWASDEGDIEDKESEETWLDTKSVDTSEGDKPVLVRLVVTDGHSDGEVARERTILVRQKQGSESGQPEVGEEQSTPPNTKLTAATSPQTRSLPRSGTLPPKDRGSTSQVLPDPYRGTFKSAEVSEPYRVAMTFYRDRRYKEALGVCERALVRWPHDTDLQALKGRILTYLKELDDPTVSAPPAMNGGSLPADKDTPPVGQVPVTRPEDSQAAQLIYKVEPQYPSIARANNISGLVVVEIVIDTNGNVASAKAVKGNAILRQAAEEAVRKRRYKPAMRGGQPVASRATILINFKPPA